MLLFGGATLQDTGYTPLDLNDMWLYSAESNAWTFLTLQGSQRLKIKPELLASPPSRRGCIIIRVRCTL